MKPEFANPSRYYTFFHGPEFLCIGRTTSQDARASAMGSMRSLWTQLQLQECALMVDAMTRCFSTG